MLVVLGKMDGTDRIKEKAKKIYGTVLEYSLPNIEEGDEKEIEEKALHIFNLVAAAEDSCANQPFPFAVLITPGVYLPLLCKVVNIS